ncbi:MAG: hypothetical protein WBW33_07150, partial [Bryobacteraceae bacterium]
AFHITARGNYRPAVFFSDQDRTEYLELLGRHATLEGLEIFGWCLMTNHTTCSPFPGNVPPWRGPCDRPRPTIRSVSIAASVPAVVTSGSPASTRARSRRDAVWTVLRFIELNPVRAELVAKAEQSSWSSAAIHCGLRPPHRLLSVTEWEREWTPARWQSVLALGTGEREFEAIRQATQRGLPLGDQTFIDGFERSAGRTLAVRPVGRPRLVSAATPAPLYSAGGMPLD